MKALTFLLLVAVTLVSFTATEQLAGGSEGDGSCGCGAATSRGEPSTIVAPTTLITSNTKDNNMIEENMVTIPGGLGYIGTDHPIMRRDGEEPRRPVSVTSFQLDRYEVSNNGKCCNRLCFHWF